MTQPCPRQPRQGGSHDRDSQLVGTAVSMVVTANRYAAIGMELGVAHLTAVAVDLDGRQILSWRRRPLSRGTPPGLAIAHTARLARGAVARVRSEGATVVGLTVAVPGLVDGSGVVRSAPALAWMDVDLRRQLDRALGHPDFPVDVDSGATLAALAEHRCGRHAGTPHLVCLAGQTGVDVGVVSGGVPLRGTHGYGVELGHVSVDRIGPGCACGRAGCLVAVAELNALLRRAGVDPGDGDTSELDIEVADLVRRAGAGDKRVLAALVEVGASIGYAVGMLINLFDPQAVLLGGYHAALAPWTLPAVERTARSIAVTPDHASVRLAVSTLGHEAAALGAAQSALTAPHPAGTGLSRAASAADTSRP